MSFDTQKQLVQKLDELEKSLREMRMAAYDIMPQSLVYAGLGKAVGDLCAHYSHYGIRIIYQEYNLGRAMLERGACITIYNICRELLVNALRHAQATCILVQLSYHQSRFLLTVEDNGKGMAEAQAHPSSGAGWYSVRAEVARCGGSVDVKHVFGGGTSVTIMLSVSGRPGAIRYHIPRKGEE